MQNNTANLNIMIKAARKLPDHLLEILMRSRNFRLSKKAGDFVSKADLELKSYQGITFARPNYDVVPKKVMISEKPYKKVGIDPLDGTTNFLHGIPRGLSLSL